MKTIYQHLTLLTFMFTTLVSCQKYIEDAPLSQATVDQFYKTPKDAEVALIGIYSILSNNDGSYGRSLITVLNGGNDELLVNFNTTNRPDDFPFGDASFSATSEFLKSVWATQYRGIYRANLFLEQVDQIPAEKFSGNRKAALLAEARLLRGFFHMTLSMMHGAIPVYTSTAQEATLPRHTLEEVYRQIIEDYSFAYENLEARGPRSTSVNKYTAAALLARVYTYLASAKNNGYAKDFSDLPINSFDWVDADECYRNALALTTDIVLHSGYILIPEYRRLFRPNTKADQYKECLMLAEASSDASARVTNSIRDVLIPQGNRDTRGGGAGTFRPTGQLYDLYMNIDNRFSNNLTGNLNSNTTEELDGVTFFVPRAAKKDQSYYCVGKFRMRAGVSNTLSSGASDMSIPIIRYAEVLLLHAEALYFTGDESAAREIFTQIRQRAVAGNAANLEKLNSRYRKADFIEELLDERSRELCFENLRKIDLARFGKLTNVIKSLDETNGFYNKIVPQLQANWIPERVWFPIPDAQILLNNNLEQNLGFN
ncbi:RagB/SusD family nutrient uptake outer membrane protein [Niabella insulamsoli]|uniref:RagB/SusD family nutrient uptake outer membrane protein n=1 Tax=Niabella insulamsoli TaxID=3144874 RepID=UPI0031FE3E5B